MGLGIAMSTEQQEKPKSTIYFHLKAEPAKQDPGVTRVTVRLINTRDINKCDSVAGAVRSTLERNDHTTGNLKVDRAKLEMTLGVISGHEKRIMAKIRTTLIERHLEPATSSK